MEIADVLRRRKVDIACVQEVKWKGSKARNVGHGYKLFYHGDTSNRNGVGIILREERTKDIVEISRISDRIILLNKRGDMGLATKVAFFITQRNEIFT